MTVLRVYTIVSLILGCLLVVSADLGDTVDEQWESFKIKYKKVYKSPEEAAKRRDIFEENLQYFHEVNENKSLSFKVGVNRDADLSKDEIYQRLKRDSKFWSYLPKLFISSIALPQTIKQNHSDLPESVDWREENAVTEVQDQFMDECGSCYAFAAVSSVESHHAIKTGNLFNLSKQEIVDCSKNSKCDGGNGIYTFNYVMKNGISLEHDYPYEAKQRSCNKDAPRSEVKVYGYADIDDNDEETLKEILAFHGPVMTTMCAQSMSLNFYKEGVYDDPTCNNKNYDHAVLIVGYGRSEKHEKDFWIVKNSWSDDWGEGGYLRIASGKKTCGIGVQMFYPLMEESDADNNQYIYVLAIVLGVLICFFLVLCCICTCLSFCIKKLCCRQKRSYAC